MLAWLEKNREENNGPNYFADKSSREGAFALSRPLVQVFVGGTYYCSGVLL